MEDRDWERIRERLELTLPIRVHCRETLDLSWTEVTRLIDVTPFGAAFSLKRPAEKGRLLQLTIPMPRQLRVFDHIEDQYKVWSIVRYVRAMSPEPSSAGTFKVGVAFIGKRPPASFETEPWKRYEISTSRGKQLPDLVDLKPIVTSDQRVGTRHNMPVEIEIEMIGSDGKVEQSESTVTENISRRGANIFTNLNYPPGRFIRIHSGQYALTVHAAIRSQSTGVDGIGRIHVEFIDQEWPL